MNDLSLNEYAFNQSMMEQMPPIDEDTLRQNLGTLSAWFGSNIDFRYFMMLNNDLHDYTVFDVGSKNYYNASVELYECLKYRGEVVAIDFNHDYDYYEVWIRHRTEEKICLYIIFPCNDFIITC